MFIHLFLFCFWLSINLLTCTVCFFLSLSYILIFHVILLLCHYAIGTHLQHLLLGNRPCSTAPLVSSELERLPSSLAPEEGGGGERERGREEGERERGRERGRARGREEGERGRDGGRRGREGKREGGREEGENELSYSCRNCQGGRGVQAFI